MWYKTESNRRTGIAASLKCYVFIEKPETDLGFVGCRQVAICCNLEKSLNDSLIKNCTLPITYLQGGSNESGSRKIILRNLVGGSIYV